MSTRQLPKRKATFFIRILSNPIIRQEYRVSDDGVVFVKTTQCGKKTSRLRSLCHVVLASVRTSKLGLLRQARQGKEAPSSVPGNNQNTSDQATESVTDLITFLQSQKTEAQWTQRILIRQVYDLERPITSQPEHIKAIEVHSARALNLQRSRKNYFEIKHREEQLAQALAIISGTVEKPNPRLVAKLVRFLHGQAADMTFGAEEAQNMLQELSDPSRAIDLVEHDPYTMAYIRKAKWEGRAEKYHRAADALSQAHKQRGARLRVTGLWGSEKQNKSMLTPSQLTN